MAPTLGCKGGSERDHDTKATGSQAASDASGSAKSLPFGTKTSVPNLYRIDAARLVAMIQSEKKALTLVNVWATWCGPCREELPMLASVADTYAQRGVRVLPVSVDDVDAEARIPEALATHGFSAPYYVVAGDINAFKRAMNPGWPGNIPVSFVLDAHATRRYYFNAQVYENELTPVLDQLLDGQSIEDRSHFKAVPTNPALK